MVKSQILQEKLNELLTKDMDRKSFLKHVGLAAFAMSGASAMAMFLMHSNKSKSEERKGYSAANYGGKDLAVKNTGKKG